jgi:hypothetical protein
MTRRETTASGPPCADWAEIRRDYEDAAAPLDRTAAKAGMTKQKLIRLASGAGWKPRTPAKKHKPAAELNGGALKPASLAARLKRLIAREIEAIEGESTSARDAAEKERDARRLASLVRTLEKLKDIKASKTKRKDADAKDDGDDLRAELHRRLARLAAGDGAGGIPGEPWAARDGMAD